jgi:hypothetical protein
MQPVALIAAASFAVLGIGVVLLRHRYRHHPLPRPRRPKAIGALEHTCDNCDHPLVIPPAELVPLKGADKALVVRGHPEWLKHRIAEYDCPYCEAAHCFAVDQRPPLWLGMNMYAPAKSGKRCRECGKALAVPTWTRGAYDGKIDDAPGSLDAFALVCPHCDSPCCVPCTRSFTRKRTADGSLLCPRCGRGPLEKFYHGATGT